MGPTLALLVALGAPLSVHVSGPPSIVDEVVRELTLEVPEVALVAAADARLRFNVVRSDAALWLEDGADRRRLGAVGEEAAATRICVLLLSRRLRREVAAVGATRAGELDSAAAWSVEGGGALWPGPTAASVHLGGTAAAHRRVTGPLFVGARALAVAVCCGATQDNVRVSGVWVGAFAEVLLRPRWGRFAIEASVGVGVAAEIFDARVVDLFAGPTSDERSARALPVGRAAAAASVDLFSGLTLVLRGGLHFAPVSRVRLPPPFDAGRAPVERSAVLPFLEAGLAFGL